MTFHSPSPVFILRLALAVFAILALGAPAMAANRYDPRLRFRTLSTPRFDIHYHQGEELQASRLGQIAEQVATSLDQVLGPAFGRVQVILVDQSDLPNGWATPLPYNIIEITAAVPGGESIIGNTDDWLRLVFTHEYTHIVHLSRSTGWLGGLRRVFGRLPILYPNVFLPQWQVEGIATYEESALTGAGRVPEGDFRLVAERAAAARRFEPLDRVNGGLVDWPWGMTPYVYGAYFHDFLARRYGAADLRRLTDETARRFPYFGSRAFKKVYGRSLGKLWDEFAADVRQHAHDVPSAATRLTHHGYNVIGPRFSPDGRLFYSVVNPHGFPALMALVPGASRPHQVATRYLGSRIGFSGALAVFDQIEIVNNLALQSDLYGFSQDDGRTWRLTYGARAADPDLSPDGRVIVCTVERADRRELATMEMRASGHGTAVPSAIVSAPETYFTAPQWTPDGRSIAAERRIRDGPSEIVVVDLATRQVRPVAASRTGRTVSPAWLPDGRDLLFASDREGGAFRIYRVSTDTLQLWRLEDTGPSAQSPAVSPDGSTVAFIGYTADGYDLFSISLCTARWTPVSAERRQSDGRGPLERSSGREQARKVGANGRSYSPWRTLTPRFWTPTVESDNGEVLIGAATGSADTLGRHAYAAAVRWTRARERPDWDMAYAYDRWWPTLFLSVSEDTDPWRDGEIRSREANAGLLLPIRRVRRSQSVLAALHASTDTAMCGACTPPIDASINRPAVRGGWRINAARSYGYSISAEEGWSASVTTELTRRGFGSEGDAGSSVIDLRGYRRAGARHAVFAVRAAAATAWGDERVRREFSASGNGPQPGGFRFGFDAIGLLRGFDEDAVSGRHAAVANIDFRFPLARLDRGAGTLPFFVRNLHGGLFADLGHAWNRSARARDLRTSLGAELSLDAVLGYALPATLTTGAAWWRDPTTDRRGVVAFGRIGRAF